MVVIGAVRRFAEQQLLQAVAGEDGAGTAVRTDSR